MLQRRLRPYLLAAAVGSTVVGVLALPGPDAATRASLAAGEPSVLLPPSRDVAVTAPAADRTRTAAGPTAVTLAFAGDVHFEGGLRQRLLADPAGVLAPVAGLLRSADLAMVNLETAVTDRGAPQPKQFVFRAPSVAFTALRSTGIDVVTVANNHGLDYGLVGLRDTLAAAKAAGVAVVGAGADEAAAFAPYVATVRGQRIAVIGATQVIDDSLIAAWSAGPGKPGLASAKHEAVLLDAVRRARARDDVVVVYLHWGHELADCPTAPQRDIAAALAAAGADVIVGSHAHVTLGAGYLGHSYVDYGLGNFVFYARGGGATTHGGVLNLTLQGHRVTRATWQPTFIFNGMTIPQTAAAREAAIRAHDGQQLCTGLAAGQP